MFEGFQGGWVGMDRVREVRLVAQRRAGRRGESSGETARMRPKFKVLFDGEKRRRGNCAWREGFL